MNQDPEIRHSSSTPLSPRGLAVATALLLLCTWISGCASGGPGHSGQPTPADAAAGSPSYSSNLLREGDLLNITFQYSTNFNVLQKISIDGSLNLEGIGMVKAAGTTPIELQDELARRYKSQIKEDVITVKLIGAAAGVYVVGAVLRPGKISMDHPMTVLEAVIEAGGYEATRANLSGVTVLRIVDGKEQTYRVDLHRLIQGRDVTPFYLRPSDVIHVPTKRFNF
ncbi:MAG TPA: hypothetical protein DCM86_19270 [Verrucomicrobiales bacterium]|nr:hypothetical protein [Verrucomicrobiales bacterium]